MQRWEGGEGGGGSDSSAYLARSQPVGRFEVVSAKRVLASKEIYRAPMMHGVKCLCHAAVRMAHVHSCALLHRCCGKAGCPPPSWRARYQPVAGLHAVLTVSLT